jgi:hypothetical protein
MGFLEKILIIATKYLLHCRNEMFLELLKKTKIEEY